MHYTCPNVVPMESMSLSCMFILGSICATEFQRRAKHQTSHLKYKPFSAGDFAEFHGYLHIN